MTRTGSKRELLASLGARPVVADALDPEAVGRVVSQAEPEVLVHELTAIPASVDLRRMERDFAPTNRLRTEGAEPFGQADRSEAPPVSVWRSWQAAPRWWPQARAARQRAPAGVDCAMGCLSCRRSRAGPSVGQTAVSSASSGRGKVSRPT